MMRNSASDGSIAPDGLLLVRHAEAATAVENASLTVNW
jgi:hypothetical protein